MSVWNHSGHSRVPWSVARLRARSGRITFIALSLPHWTSVQGIPGSARLLFLFHLPCHLLLGVCVYACMHVCANACLAQLPVCYTIWDCLTSTRWVQSQEGKRWMYGWKYREQYAMTPFLYFVRKLSITFSTDGLMLTARLSQPSYVIRVSLNLEHWIILPCYLWTSTPFSYLTNKRS